MYRREAPLTRSDLASVERLLDDHDSLHGKRNAFNNRMSNPDGLVRVSIEHVNSGHFHATTYELPADSAIRLVLDLCIDNMTTRLDGVRAALAEFGIDPEAP